MTNLTTRLSRLVEDPNKASLIYSYIELLLKVNRSLSLTSIKSVDSWFTEHIEDSIRAYSFFRKLNHSKFVDSGSGNGLPGVIFGILSEKPFVLCDVDSKKCEFLKTAVYRLKLNGEIYCGYIHDLQFNDEGYSYSYRGLGPDQVLIQQQKNTTNSNHFRFMSAQQSPLFDKSKIESYKLSDKSFRFLEIYKGK